MDISSVGQSALTPELQAQYAVKCIQMARQAEEMAGAVILDTIEISQEAMDKYLSEVNASK